MSLDLAYDYFREAFSEWVALLESEGKAPQKEITDLLQINKSTAHRYVKGTRNIPFDKQVEIANISGRKYLDFLIYGKKLVECKNSSLPKPPPQAQSQGKVKPEIQGDKKLEAIVEKFLSRMDKMEERFESEKVELKAKIEKLEAKNKELTAQLLVQSRRLRKQHVQPPDDQEENRAVNQK